LGAPAAARAATLLAAARGLARRSAPRCSAVLRSAVLRWAVRRSAARRSAARRSAARRSAAGHLAVRSRPWPARAAAAASWHPCRQLSGLAGGCAPRDRARAPARCVLA